MDPSIQYAKTKDGVSIAFWTLGEGMPYVHMPAVPWTQVGQEWETPPLRRWFEALSAARMLVHYNSRGTGLSDRETGGFGLDDQVLDLEAIVDHLGLKSFCLYAGGFSGPAAIAYTARHPEWVSHLVLWMTSVRGSDFAQTPRVRAMRELMDKDWELYTETLAYVSMGFEETEQARKWAAQIRESITPETVRAFREAVSATDVSDLLPELNTPTLVLHRPKSPFLDVRMARTLASRIPGARLALMEGETNPPWTGDTQKVLAAINEFLGEGEREEAAPGLASEDVHTILFTDVEGSTALTQRLGDAKARGVLREHERIVREALKAHGGSEVKTMGDGFMTSFSSATKALECAIAIQRAFAEWNTGVGAQGLAPLRVRIGLNAGEPIAEDDDLYGTAVNLAARIAAEATAGTILASDVVRQLVAGKDFLFADRGEASLKGFDEPVRLYEVRWRV